VTAILLSAFLVPSMTVEFKLLPPGHDGLVEGVGRARYYLLDEYLQLAEFDSELYMLRKDYEAITTVEEALREGMAAQAHGADVCLKELDIMSSRSGRLLEKWHTCEKALRDCGGGYLPYVIGAVGTVLTIVGTALILVAS
jgi:hypothetical protein